MPQPHRSEWSNCLIGLAFAFDFPTRSHLEASQENLLLVALNRASQAGWDLGDSLDRMLALLAENGDVGDRLRAMRREYQRLFEFPSPRVPPYESAYRGAGTAPGQTADSLQALYKEAGLKISSNFKDLPDHICIELEFFARLLEQEELREARCRQDLEESLRAWFHPFLAAIRVEARDPYYLELACISESMFRLEKGVVS